MSIVQNDAKRCALLSGMINESEYKTTAEVVAAVASSDTPALLKPIKLLGDYDVSAGKEGQPEVTKKYLDMTPGQVAESIEHPMIDVDGVQKHRHNSLGQPIHYTDEGIQNFHRWFGDNNKTVDEHGRPKVFYHGTGEHDIHTFRPTGVEGGKQSDHIIADFRRAKANNEKYGYMNFRSGSFFSEYPDYAGHYATKSTYPVYIKSENPAYMDQNTGKVTIIHQKTPDALIMHDSNPNRISEIAVIDPAQIKSATGNTGSFSHPTKITENSEFLLRLNSIMSKHLQENNMNTSHTTDCGTKLKSFAEFDADDDLDDVAEKAAETKVVTMSFVGDKTHAAFKNANPNATATTTVEMNSSNERAVKRLAHLVSSIHGNNMETAKARGDKQ